MNKIILISFAILCQLIAAFFYGGQIIFAILGINIRPINWQVYELMEIIAASGLIIGVILGSIYLKQAFDRNKKADQIINEASIAFHEILEKRFAEWNLTNSEKDVALFIIKGLSLKEIAQIRESSEGTVKSQSASIYRKAEVSGKAQLISLFVEDMFEKDA